MEADKEFMEAGRLRILQVMMAIAISEMEFRKEYAKINEGVRAYATAEATGAPEEELDALESAASALITKLLLKKEALSEVLYLVCDTMDAMRSKANLYAGGHTC